MRDQRNDNFWADVFKWFLIWNLLSLLVRGFVFVCKTILIAISQLFYLIAIGIKKLIPIAKNKFEQFKIDYTQKYKPKIDAKFSKVKQSFFNIIFNLKSKIAYLKVKSNEYSQKRIEKKEEKRKNKALKKMYKPKKHKESDFALKAKKVKYWVIDFFYSYEFQILTFGILAIAIVIALIVFNVTTK